MLSINTDGASRGNPGLSSIGVICIDSLTKKEVFKISKQIGKETNNVAEYTAVLEALKKVIELGLEEEHILLIADSALVVNQLNGDWNINDNNLKIIFNKIKDIISLNSINIKFKLIRREANKEADKLANMAFRSVESVDVINKKSIEEDGFPKLNNGVKETIELL